MYTIEKKDWGYYLVFEGFMQELEMAQCINDVIKTIQYAKTGFGVLIDMRNLKILTQESKKAMKRGQMFAQEMGIKRSAHIHSNTIVITQFKRMAKETGIYKTQRYIDASTTTDWKKKALEWIIDGIDPDLELPINKSA